MASKAKSEQPEPANLSHNQMQSAIPKLERRVAELKDADISDIQERGDPRFKALEQKMDDTLVEIFGNDTVEYRRYRAGNLCSAPMYYGRPAPADEVREGYRQGIQRAISSLKTIIELFCEKLQDLGESPAVEQFGHLMS